MKTTTFLAIVLIGLGLAAQFGFGAKALSTTPSYDRPSELLATAVGPVSAIARPTLKMSPQRKLLGHSDRFSPFCSS
jgi:hypothetical protein